MFVGNLHFYTHFDLLPMRFCLDTQTIMKYSCQNYSINILCFVKKVKNNKLVDEQDRIKISMRFFIINNLV